MPGWKGALMPGRKPLPMGSYGSIATKQDASGWRASARYRDNDGVTRPVSRRGKTKAAATRALVEDLNSRSQADSSGTITPETTLEALAGIWRERATYEARLRPQTIGKYQAVIRATLIPRMGSLRAREATVAVLDRHIREVGAVHPTTAKHLRIVLKMLLDLAVHQGALSVNAATATSSPRSTKKAVRALTDDEVHRLREAIRAYGGPSWKKHPRAENLLDVLDFALATGCRINEAAAVRWEDVDLVARTVRICGTLVRVTGQGQHRQAWGKTDASLRTLHLPDFAIDIIERRRREWPIGEPVFVSMTGTYLNAHNLRTALREAREGTGLEWVSPQSMRRTVGTAISRSEGTRAAADQLGHTKEDVTEASYIEKVAQRPDRSQLLEGFAPRDHP